MRCVVVAVVLAGCFRGDPPPPANPTITLAAPRTQPDRSISLADPLAFLPGDAELAVAIDMKPLRTSPLWPSVEQLLRTRLTSLTSFVQTCSFDPIASLRSLSVGLRDLKANSPSGSMVVGGYDRDTFMQCLASTAGTNQKLVIDHGVAVVAGTVAMTFVDSKTLVAILVPNASARTLRDVLDGGAPLRMTQWVGDMLPKLDMHHPLWVIYNGPSLPIPKGRGLGGSLEVDGQGIAASFRLRFDDDAAATQMATTMQGQVGGAQGMFTQLDIAADLDEVTIRIRATVAQMQMLLGIAGMTSPPPPPPPTAPPTIP